MRFLHRSYFSVWNRIENNTVFQASYLHELSHDIPKIYTQSRQLVGQMANLGNIGSVIGNIDDLEKGKYIPKKLLNKIK